LHAELYRYGPFFGWNNDKHMINLSRLEERLSEYNEEHEAICLYGDCGYMFFMNVSL